MSTKGKGMGGIRGRPLPTTPEAAALFHPVRGNAPISAFGVPFICLRTGRRELFDPWQGRVDRSTVAPTYFLHGTLGSGKTALAMMLAARLGGLQAGLMPDKKRPRTMRVRIHDRKISSEEGVEGRGEYAPLSDFLHTDIINLNRNGHFNILDAKMVHKYEDYVEIVVNTAEQILGMSPLPGYIPIAFQIGCWKMLKVAPDNTSAGLLEAILRKLDVVDVNTYYKEIDKRVFAGREDLLSELNLRISEPEHVVESEFLADAKKAAAALHELLYGRFGGVFGDERSLYDALSASHTTINWFGVNDEASSIMDAIMMKWQVTAVESGNRSIIPHVEITDEAHNAVSRIMYARFYVKLLKEARSLKTARFISTQSEKDITMHGDDGSALAKLTEGLRDAIGGYFFGKLKYTKETIARLVELGLSEQEAVLVTMLEPGCFALKQSLRSDTPFVQIIPGRSEWGLIQTDAASEEMVTRLPILEFEGMEQRAALMALQDKGEISGNSDDKEES